MMRTVFKALMVVLLMPAAHTVQADTREDFLADSTLSADNYVAYRPPVGDVLTAAPEDVLVKFLINEREAMSPQEVQPVSVPYYRWTDARWYLQSRLDAFDVR